MGGAGRHARVFGAVAWVLASVIGLGAGVPPPPKSAGGPSRPALRIGKREEIIVHWVHHPVRFVPKGRGGCEGLDPEMIEVTEDGGPPLPVAELSMARLPTIHAVVLDVSGSRTGFLPVAVDAAAQYAEQIRSDDEMAVLAMGENLRMVEGFAPAQEVASRLSRRRQELVPFGLTGLWDGLDDLLRYIAPRPERKVVILLSDCCDTASLLRRIQRGAPDPLFDQLARVENLSLFSVGLAVPRRCFESASLFDPRGFLDRLAHRSGGASFAIPFQASPKAWRRKLDRVFDQVRRRLEAEGSITYRPQPFGEGPRDEAGKRAGRWRKVRVRWADGRERRRCRLAPAGPSTRYEGKPVAIEGAPRLEALLQAGEGPVPLTRPLRLPLTTPWTRGCEGRSEPPANGRCAGVGQGCLELSAAGIRGRVLDLVHGQGQLYDVAESAGGRTYDTRIQWKPRFALTDVALDPPPLEQLRSLWADLDLALLAQTARGAPPSIIDGSTFFQVRARLGQALMVRPDYREWARRRLYEEKKREIRVLWRDVDSADWKRIEPLLELRARRVEAEEPQRVLAEWLGDIEAFSLAERVQGRVINAMLIVPEGQEPSGWRARAGGVIGLAEEHWDQWAGWFPIATDRRIVTPLIPVYDPGKEVIGYYRVILPGPGLRHSRRESPPHRWPDAPLPLMLMDDLLRRPPVAAALVGRALVRSIDWRDYSETDARRLYLEWRARRSSRDAPRPAFEFVERTRHVIEITFTPAAGGGPEGRVRMRAFYGDSEGSDPPLCLELAASASGAPRPPWSDALQRALEAERLLCPRHVPIDMK